MLLLVSLVLNQKKIETSFHRLIADFKYMYTFEFVYFEDLMQEIFEVCILK